MCVITKKTLPVNDPPTGNEVVPVGTEKHYSTCSIQSLADLELYMSFDTLI